MESWLSTRLIVPLMLMGGIVPDGNGMSRNLCTYIPVSLYTCLLFQLHYFPDDMSNVRFMSFDGFGQFELDERAL